MISILEKLELLYGKERALACNKEIQFKIETFNKGNTAKRKSGLDEDDLILITYGDQFQGRGQRALKNLSDFSEKYFKEIFSGIHILPFYPYTSDDGFSVVDYIKVGEQCGEWEDIEGLDKNFRLMFDFVCNHISAESEWFKKYLAGDEEYKDFFISVDPNEDLSKVIRPRALPLLTAFDSNEGKKYIWTTFSEDQIDLNFSNEKVLLRTIDVLLFYVEKGADLIRLDAIGFMWKKIGTTCIHLKETHAIVQLMKDVLELTAPEVVLVTETNVPHKDNISYFGNGYNEAKMVYQFPLPPLTLFTFMNENAAVLSKWADSLKPISESTTFFNFLASHDGIGVNPARGIVEESEITKMAETVKERGGYVSYKNNPDGTQSPYELNISYFNAINNPSDPIEIQIKKFVTAQSFALSIMGVPGIYVHSTLGSQNYQNGVDATGRYRSINREKFDVDNVEKELNDSESLRAKIYGSLGKLIKIRRKEKAFHPNGEQKVLFIDDEIFSLLRTSVNGAEKIIALSNVSNKSKDIQFNLKFQGIINSCGKNLITEEEILINDDTLKLTLHAYETAWIKF